MVIAPATANTISKMVNGACDNFLLAVYMSANCPIFYAPAMDLDMYAHPSTARNFQLLESYGNIQIPAEEGELASGLVGKGRMAEPETIISFMQQALKEDKKPLEGKTVDRKSTRLNSSHVAISYAVFCLKKKRKKDTRTTGQG